MVDARPDDQVGRGSWLCDFGITDIVWIPVIVVWLNTLEKQKR